MSHRYHIDLGERCENARVDAFLAEVVEVCRKHNLSIGHEDGHGAFVVTLLNDRNIRWLSRAQVEGVEEISCACEHPPEVHVGFDKLVELVNTVGFQGSAQGCTACLDCQPGLKRAATEAGLWP